MTPSEGVMLRIIAGMLESLAGWMDGWISPYCRGWSLLDPSRKVWFYKSTFT